MNQRSASSSLPLQPFFSTPQQRRALARQRYFDEGVHPSGLIHESLIQSWSRCVQSRRNPAERIAFNPVTPSRIHSALARSRMLLEAAEVDLTQLENTLAGTACTAILTDAEGVVVHATRSATDHGEVLVPLARRVGVSLDEAHVGTAAPGVTLRTGQPCLVLGGEHFFAHLQVLHCAAAPIRDVHGKIAAVLDLTSESRSFGFDAAAVVALYATTIENRLLRAQSAEHIVVHMQTTLSLLGTPMEGLAGVDSHGCIAWLNNVGARLLGVTQGETGSPVMDVIGLNTSRLASLTRETGAAPHRLPNGLNVWLTARIHAHDGAPRLIRLGQPAGAEVAPSPALPALPSMPCALPGTGLPTGTLRDSDHHLVAQTVHACGGNVSQAARSLGVSRGLVYRHLKRTKRTGQALAD